LSKAVPEPACPEATPELDAQIIRSKQFGRLALDILIISVVVKSSEEKLVADEQIRAKVELSRTQRGVWSCRDCAYSNARKEVVFKHVDAKHMDLMYRCDYCTKLTPTQHALKEHIRSNHKESNLASYPVY
jgi:aspartate carbamoyltransferase regulatory subunit